MGAKNFKETRVYRLAFKQAMELFEVSKSFPKEETPLQIRSKDRQGVFAPTLARPIAKKYILLILS
jgi:hypothetical protein